VEFEVLAELSPSQRQLIIDECIVKRFARGAVIISQGDVGEEFWLIESGRVALRVTNPSGEAVTLSVLSPGQAFGEMALVGRRRRTATATALEPVVARAMSRESFDTLRRDHPAVDRLLVDILASRVDRLSVQLSEALFMPVETRLARRLLTLCEVYRRGTHQVELPLTQEDIASVVGTSRPTVNQILNRLATEGTVELRRGVVRICDEPALRRIAAG
jgi:CRP/FNR family transcriptional regulator, cyclic AMP receptor protein